MANPQTSNPATISSDSRPVRFLLPVYVQMIEEALASLGEYGEVRLVVEKGRLRFLITHKSYDMLKMHPGAFIKEFEPLTD